ncbi:hypothetical protein [Rhodomicrobium vannielii]|uniref:hypothetical protein n=1 Tax=Rhodomicrobium vannielii TaxID=1069 RepID=UPI0009D673E7|nr:hypothetical protein [Rhodomicrobium vannielii]
MLLQRVLTGLVKFPDGAIARQEIVNAEPDEGANRLRIEQVRDHHNGNSLELRRLEAANEGRVDAPGIIQFDDQELRSED